MLPEAQIILVEFRRRNTEPGHILMWPQHLFDAFDREGMGYREFQSGVSYLMLNGLVEMVEDRAQTMTLRLTAEGHAAAAEM